MAWGERVKVKCGVTSAYSARRYGVGHPKDPVVSGERNKPLPEREAGPGLQRREYESAYAYVEHHSIFIRYGLIK